MVRTVLLGAHSVAAAFSTSWEFVGGVVTGIVGTALACLFTLLTLSRIWNEKEQ